MKGPATELIHAGEVDRLAAVRARSFHSASSVDSFQWSWGWV